MKKIASNTDNGEIMVESLIVYSVTIFLLFFILAIFSVLFQRWNIQTIANESATKIAQTYKLSAADIVDGYATKDEITNIPEYRYIFNKDDVQKSAESKVIDYAKLRLSKTTFTKNASEPKFDFSVESDSLGRRHIVLEISGEYTVPFGQALSYFGFESTITYKAKAYADCLDLIDYTNTIDYVDNQSSLGQFNSKFIKMIDKIFGLFDNIVTRGEK